ncbi:MAG: efflux RND transporter permease subunit [Spirochaetaceae bacterium]|jgi:multidrug efflux pump subunit AcrB|nr:efflux RND transporter permease subunit [Spirochaetaceae bacterium]
MEHIIKNKKNYFESILTHYQIPLTLIVFLCAVGIVAFVTMPRQQFPTFSVLEGLVIAAYPGASSEQVDAELTKPLLNYLYSFEKTDRENTYAVTREGLCVVYLYVAEGVLGDSVEIFWSKLRLGLNDFKAQLPAQTLLLEGDDDFGKTSSILLSLSSDKRSYRELGNYLDILNNMLNTCNEIASIETYGLQNEKIVVYVDGQKLSFYGIDTASILSILQIESLTGYAAAIDNAASEIPIHVKPRITSEADLANQIIFESPDGKLVRLGDVARIEREYDVDSSFVKSNLSRSVVLSMEMTDTFNIVEFGKKIDTILETFKTKIPQDVDIIKISDMPGIVKTSINHFFRDFLLAIISVIIVIVLSLPLRVAAVSALTIPISMLIGIFVLYLMGVQLNTVSLASLVLVLGMVVDDSIVVIDNHIEKLDHGQDPWTSAWSSAAELFVPALTATLAIIMAFLPTSFFLTGMYKEFIAPAPITVSVSLLASLLVASHFVPILTSRFIKTGTAPRESIIENGIENDKENSKKTGKKKHRKNLLDFLQIFYDNKVLPFSLKNPRTAMAVAFLCTVLGIAGFTILPRQLFPKLEQNQFAVEIYLPAGTSIQKNAEITEEISAILLKDKRVKNVISFVGQSSPRFNTLYVPLLPSDYYSQLIVVTGTEKETVEVLHEYDQKYRDAFPLAHIKWKQLDFLPTAAPIEISITDHDKDKAKAFAEEVKNIMCSEDNLIWIRDDWSTPFLAAGVSLKDSNAFRVGVNRTSLIASSAIYNTGIPLGEVWDGDYRKEIILKHETGDPQNPLSPKHNPSLSDLGNSFVISPEKNHLTFNEVANIEPEFTQAQIVRRYGVYSVTVSADVAFNKLTAPIFDRVNKKIKALPDYKNINISYGGEHKMEIETYIPFAKSFLVSCAGIFLIMLFQFKRLKTALLVMFTQPLSIIGGVLGLLIIGYPFGMTSFMGFIGIMGICIRNGVILISYANDLRSEKGMSVYDAAIAAGKRRMRPIVLTASAAIVGVIPLISSGSSLWGPLGSVLCFGLLGSTILTLFVLPAAYYLFFKHEDDIKKNANTTENGDNIVKS